MMKGFSLKFCFLFLLYSSYCSGQGYNHTWLLSYDFSSTSDKARINFTDSSYSLVVEQREMPFLDTEGNISDSNGNLLMVSNGKWIANNTGDTMQNGDSLNPGVFANQFDDGLVIPNGNVFIPYPGDTNKYILFHHTGNTGGSIPSNELLYSIIDMSLDNGLGGVTLKNATVFLDTLSWGIGACKHANGRDWWIVMVKDNSDIIYKVLVDSGGISNVSTQNLGIFPFPYGNVTQPTFSPDGKKFAFSYSGGGSVVDHYVYLLDFDRCSGMFSNSNVFDLAPYDSTIGIGVAFSPNSRFIYATSFITVFQIDVNTLSIDTVATYDGFSFPFPAAQTYFDLLYLAANGKIYIQTPSSAQHIHEINSPDSIGQACNVQQHSIFLTVWNLRTVPFHPNYYLGCDTTSGCPCLTTSLNEIQKQDFKFSLSPNPSNGNIKLMYILPQNKSGTFQILDITGKQVFKSNLPQWSTLQNFNVENLSNGIYLCKITSDNFTATKKLIIQKE